MQPFLFFPFCSGFIKMLPESSVLGFCLGKFTINLNLKAPLKISGEGIKWKEKIPFNIWH